MHFCFVELTTKRELFAGSYGFHFCWLRVLAAFLCRKVGAVGLCFFKFWPVRLNHLFPGLPPYWSSGNLARSQGSGPDHQSVLKPNFADRLAQNAASKADHYKSLQSNWGQGFVGNPEYGDKYPNAPDDTEEQGPFFTDLSALTPVYASSSRSRYQNGRAVFAQTRYIPGDPVYPSMPVSYRYSQRSGGGTGPAHVPKKGSVWSCDVMAAVSWMFWYSWLSINEL